MSQGSRARPELAVNELIDPPLLIFDVRCGYQVRGSARLWLHHPEAPGGRAGRQRFQLMPTLVDKRRVSNLLSCDELA